MRQYASSQPFFYHASGGHSDRMSKYREIISPQRSEVIPHRSEAVMSKWIDTSMGGTNGDRLARTELMDRSRPRANYTREPMPDNITRNSLNRQRSASRTETSHNRLDYVHKPTQEVTTIQPRRSGVFDAGNTRKTDPERRELVPSKVTSENQPRPIIHVVHDRKEMMRTPPRVSYRPPVSRKNENQEGQLFSEKIMTILDTQHQQLQVILNEMQKVTSIMSNKNSTSGSKMAAHSVDGQESEVNLSSQIEKNSTSVIKGRLKSASHTLKAKDSFTSSGVSHSNLPVSRSSKARRNLFATQKGFQEDNISRSESSPVSKSSVEDINLDELSERQLLELKTKIESKLSNKADSVHKLSSTKSGHKPTDLVLKKLGHPSHVHLVKEQPAIFTQKPPLSHQKPK